MTHSVPDWRARLRIAIEGSGRKHSTIARGAGVAPETLSRILNNKHAHPAFDTVLRIAHALDGTVSWLLAETQPGSAAPAAPSIDIPRAYALRGARAVYHARGESMLGAGITDGDLLFVHPTPTVLEAADRIVVCRIDGTLHVRHLAVRGKQIRLLCRNERHAPIEFDATEAEPRSFEVIGIVVGLMSG